MSRRSPGSLSRCACGERAEEVGNLPRMFALHRVAGSLEEFELGAGDRVGRVFAGTPADDLTVGGAYYERRNTDLREHVTPVLGEVIPQ